jgi:hypothetical protein
MNGYDYQYVRNYRKNEIHPDVYSFMEMAWVRSKHAIIPKMIDNAIEIQNSRSVVTACNYIRYLVLHELTWVDVFGSRAREYDEQLKHYKQCQDLEMKIDNLQHTVDQMQTIMMNMAKMLINKEKENVLKRA